MKNLCKIFMAFAILFSITSVTYQAHAQISNPYNISAADDTLVNADAAIVALTFDGSFESIEGSVLEVTGVTGGKIIFQGQALHGYWVGIDSLSLSDTTYLQWKMFNVPTVRTYKAYRLYYLKSGTGTAAIKAYYLRYTGGAILRSNPYDGLALYRPMYQRSWSNYILMLQPLYDKRNFTDKRIFNHRQLAG